VEVEGLPKSGPARPAQISKAQEKTLANGLRVIVVERPGLPLLSAELLIKSGAEADPPHLPGLANFTVGLLKRGTTTRNASKIAEDIEALGAKVDTEAAWDATSVKLTTLSSNAEPALAIVADLVRNPTFAREEVDRQRREMSDDLVLALEQPGTVAKYAADRAALGASPYAHPEGGTPAALAHFTRKGVIALHAQAYRPGNAILLLAGNITAPDAFALVEKVFGDWKAPAGPAAKVVPPATASTPPARDILIDMPVAGQAAVYLTAPGITRTADDWYAAKVANALLGGGYSSWLNQEVRVKRGLSYGAGSRLSTWRNAGQFGAAAQTKNESATEVVKVMQAQIQRLSAEPASEEYLKSRQAVLTGAFDRDLETDEGYTSRFGELALYDLPLATLDEYVDKVEQTTAAELQAFASKHLALDEVSVIVAGQAKIAEKSLHELLPKLEVIPAAKLDLDSPTLRPPGKH
jgi:zinc protease